MKKIVLIYLVQRTAADLGNASETAKCTREASLHACFVLILLPRPTLETGHRTLYRPYRL